MVDVQLSLKPLKKLNGTGRQVGAQDHVLSQADALTKNYETYNRSARVQV